MDKNTVKKIKLNVKKGNCSSKLKMTWDVTADKRCSLGSNRSSPVRPDSFQRHQELGRCLTTDSWPSALLTGLGCRPLSVLFIDLLHGPGPLGLEPSSRQSLLVTFHFVFLSCRETNHPKCIDRKQPLLCFWILWVSVWRGHCWGAFALLHNAGASARTTPMGRGDSKGWALKSSRAAVSQHSSRTVSKIN